MLTLPVWFGNFSPVPSNAPNGNPNYSNNLAEFCPSFSARSRTCDASLFPGEDFQRGPFQGRTALDWSSKDYVYGKNSKIDPPACPVKKNRCQDLFRYLGVCNPVAP